MYLNKDERTARGRLPVGPYLMRVKRMERKQFKTGKQGYELLLQLEGTDLVLHWFLSPNAAWAWRDAVPSFDRVPEMKGRLFLVYVGTNEYQDRINNQVKAILAEVIE